MLCIGLQSPRTTVVTPVHLQRHCSLKFHSYLPSESPSPFRYEILQLENLFLDFFNVPVCYCCYGLLKALNQCCVSSIELVLILSYRRWGNRFFFSLAARIFGSPTHGSASSSAASPYPSPHTHPPVGRGVVLRCCYPPAAQTTCSPCEWLVSLSLKLYDER